MEWDSITFIHQCGMQKYNLHQCGIRKWNFHQCWMRKHQCWIRKWNLHQCWFRQWNLHKCWLRKWNLQMCWMRKWNLHQCWLRKWNLHQCGNGREEIFLLAEFPPVWSGISQSFPDTTSPPRPAKQTQDYQPIHFSSMTRKPFPSTYM